MEALLQLIAILVLGFLSSHLLSHRLQKHLLFVSGIEYIILGLVLGPQVTNLMTAEIVGQLSPVTSLAMGTLGLLYGLRFRGHGLTQIRTEYYRISLIDTLLTYLVVGCAIAAILWRFSPPSGTWEDIGASAAALGASAAVSAPTAIYAVTHRYRAKGPITDLLVFLISFGQFSGIVLFGLIFCVFRGGTPLGIEVTRTEWVAVNIGFGIVFGMLFFLFLGNEKADERLLLALIGIVIFSSGVSYFLKFSPLFLNLVLGLVLGISTSIRERLLKVLLSLEHPMYVLLMVFGGASWRSGDGTPPLLILAVGFSYIVLRYSTKLAGGMLAQRTSPDRENLPSRLGFGVISQGAVAVAMAINFQQVYIHSFVSVVTTSVLMSVIFTEFIGQRLTKDLLVDCGEIVIIETKQEPSTEVIGTL